jgi:hypothetical protein
MLNRRVLMSVVPGRHCASACAWPNLRAISAQVDIPIGAVRRANATVGRKLQHDSRTGGNRKCDGASDFGS